jgi:hypothetical protein
MKKGGGENERIHGDVRQKDDEITVCESSNKEFTAIELIGLLEMKTAGHHSSSHEDIAPEIMYRRFIEQGVQDEEADA